MQTTGPDAAPFRRVTRSRSIRFGFSRGSAALATMSSLVDVGDEDLLPAAAGAAEAPVARFDPLDDPFADAGSVFSAGRKQTRSPAATTWRWSVLSVFSSRRVAHW